MVVEAQRIVAGSNCFVHQNQRPVEDLVAALAVLRAGVPWSGQTSVVEEEVLSGPWTGRAAMVLWVACSYSGEEVQEAAAVAVGHATGSDSGDNYRDVGRTADPHRLASG